MSNQTKLVPLPGNRATGISVLPSFVRSSPDGADLELKRSIQAVLNAKKVAVVVGAGISTSANIPDFRSSTGLFASLKSRFPNARLSSGRDLFDVNAWKDPDTLSLHFGMLAELHKMCGAAQPTAFHQFLKRLDDDGKLSRVYTQNIDGLEEKAGLSYGVPGSDDSSSTLASSRSRIDANPTSPKRNLKRKRGQIFPQNLPPTPRSTPPPQTAEARSDDDGQILSSSQSDLSSIEPCSSQLSSVSTVCPSEASFKTATTENHNPPLVASQTRSSRPKLVDPFPRVIPLHGTLKNLSCPTCKHSVLMSDYIGPLAEGETILCPQCQSFDDARAISGFRSRGVGTLKSGVVLYGEEHSEGDKVGAVTSRDLMRGRRPDLLIVAGTSLKVPGTKRLVKELSKVIRPPTVSTDEEEDEEESPTRSQSGKKPTPIHTIFLNNEFPSPCSLWKDTFDVWVKGNVDQFIKMVEEERDSQEEIKQKRALVRVERERKKQERMQQASQEQAGPLEESHLRDINNSCVTEPTVSKARKPTKVISTRRSCKPSVKEKKVEVVAKSKEKTSVSRFFKSGKATVTSSTALTSDGKKARSRLKTNKNESKKIH
ncbi:DHS-like NAD/FAD-binding domain-containing protein [Phakopsora pachyrhizi]|nr:DHS-like NAD/FAD-binding domain-containing protein [Phakopsora pachyrhizi]